MDFKRHLARRLIIVSLILMGAAIVSRFEDRDAPQKVVPPGGPQEVAQEAAREDAPAARQNAIMTAAEPSEQTDDDSSPTDSAVSATDRDTATAAHTVLVMRDVTIRDLRGNVVFQGDTDVGPTLDRIARGERHSHRNDGSVFRNLERLLPQQPMGYYREYVHPTPGLDGPGPQRIVIGAEGEAWYTADHYKSFKKIRE